MTDQVTVSNDRGDQKTLKGAKARKVKAGVQRHLKRGTAAPIKPGKHMTSRRGRAPQKGGVELPAGDVSIDASTELVRGARLALAERIISKMMETTDAQWAAFNKATGHVSRADQVRQGAKEAGKRFDNVTKKAKKAGALIRQRANGQTTDQTTKT